MPDPPDTLALIDHDAALALAGTDSVERTLRGLEGWLPLRLQDFATFAGGNASFSIESLELIFGKNFVLDGAGRWLARRNLEWYERHAAWIFPAQDIRCHLKVRK